MAKEGPVFRSAARELGVRIRSFRTLRCWTLEQAAEQMTLEARHLQRIEAGTINATLVTLTRIASGFDVRVGDLFQASSVTSSSTSHDPIRENSGGPSTRAPTDAGFDRLLRTIGLQLADARRNHNLTQIAFARRMRMPVERLRRIETGRAKTLPIKTIARLASALDLDPATLFEPREAAKPRRGRPAS